MFKKSLNVFVSITFVATFIVPTIKAHATGLLGLPEPGTMVGLSAAYQPAILKGLTVHKDNPFMFDFLVDVGHDKLQGESLRIESDKLIKYFMATLAIPEKDLWVNLSPYENDRTIPEVLGQTDMGRDLLAQDYMLKQLTASLIYPEKELGKKFWDNVYQKTQAKYGNINIPVNTFNKVWIMADKVEVFERNQTAFVTGSHLKVMLEEDYLATNKNLSPPKSSIGGPGTSISGFPTQTLGNDKGSQTSQIIKDIILPELEHEINTGKNFANLRQIFNSIILATWYKNNLKQSLLNEAYANKSTIKGIDIDDKTIKTQIYDRYLQAYKKGVFNFVKEDEKNKIPRKYFSGGVVGNIKITKSSQAMASRSINAGNSFARIQTNLLPVSDQAMTTDLKALLVDYFAAIERANGALPSLQRKASDVVAQKKIELMRAISSWPALKDILQALSDENDVEARILAEQYFGNLPINPQDAAMNAIDIRVLSDIKKFADRRIIIDLINPADAKKYRTVFINHTSPNQLKDIVEAFNLSQKRNPRVQLIEIRDERHKVVNVHFGWKNATDDDRIIRQLIKWVDLRIQEIILARKANQDAAMNVQDLRDLLKKPLNVVVNGKTKTLSNGLEFLGVIDVEESDSKTGVKVLIRVEENEKIEDVFKLAVEAISAFIVHFTVDYGKEHNITFLSNETIEKNAQGKAVVTYQFNIERLVSEKVDAAMRVDELKRLVEELNYRGVTSSYDTAEHVFHLDGQYDLDFNDLVKRLNVRLGQNLENQFVYKENVDMKNPDPRIEFTAPLNIEQLKEYIQDIIKSQTTDQAMQTSPKGGIDLKDAAAKTSVRKEGNGVEFMVDAAMIERVRREGIQSLTPVILRIDPSVNIWPLLGLVAQ